MAETTNEQAIRFLNEQVRVLAEWGRGLIKADGELEPNRAICRECRAVVAEYPGNPMFYGNTFDTLCGGCGAGHSVRTIGDPAAHDDDANGRTWRSRPPLL
jgi:hypothetical protein